jgi:hypothetical protein
MKLTIVCIRANQICNGLLRFCAVPGVLNLAHSERSATETVVRTINRIAVKNKVLIYLCGFGKLAQLAKTSFKFKLVFRNLLV